MDCLTIERIGNTIETTLFYYSDDSTSAHIWLSSTYLQKTHTVNIYMYSMGLPTKGNLPIETKGIPNIG
jgi:hypothetical protein